MKIRPYQLARLFDGAVHGRRVFLTLGVTAALLILAAMLGMLWAVVPVLTLLWGGAALYSLHRHHAFGATYQRKPRPKDAQAETILIDASLIGQGTRVRAAAQPIDTAEGLSLRLGSGALLLGAAMVHTSDTLPRGDRAAVLSAVQSLNIQPARMRSHSPVLRREEEGEITIVTVRDGVDERRFYLGEPWKLAGLCQAIWEEAPRPMTDHDRLRVADTAQYIAQGNCRVLAFATAVQGEQPTFLGMCGVGEEVHVGALPDIAGLRGMGLTVMLDAGIQPDADLDALRTLLSLPEHHARADIHLAPREISGKALGITRRAGDSLLEPVTALRQHFTVIENTLRRFCLFGAIPMLTSLLTGCFAAALISGAMLLYTAIFLGVDLNRPGLRRRTMAILAVLAVLTRLFLGTLGTTLTLAGGALLTCGLCMGLCIRLCGSAWQLTAIGWKSALPVLALTLAGVVLAVLTALPAGSAMLLPLLFSGLIAGAGVLLLLWEPRLFP